MTDYSLEDSKLVKRKGKTIDSDIHPRFIIHNSLTSNISPTYPVKNNKLSNMTKEIQKSWKEMQDQLEQLKGVKARSPFQRKKKKAEKEECAGKLCYEIRKSNGSECESRVFTGEKGNRIRESSSSEIVKPKVDIEVFIGSPIVKEELRDHIIECGCIIEESQSKEASVNTSPIENHKRENIEKLAVSKWNQLNPKYKTPHQSCKKSFSMLSKNLKPVKIKEECLKETLDSIVRKQHEYNPEAQDLSIEVSFRKEDISDSSSASSLDMSHSSSYTNLYLRKSSTSYSAYNISSVIQNKSQNNISQNEISYYYNNSFSRPRTSYVPNLNRHKSSSQGSLVDVSWKRKKKNKHEDLLISGHKSQILPKQIKIRQLTPSLYKGSLSCFSVQSKKPEPCKDSLNSNIPGVKPGKKSVYYRVKRALHSNNKLKSLLD
jgi:hypothetical protein